MCWENGIQKNYQTEISTYKLQAAAKHVTQRNLLLLLLESTNFKFQVKRSYELVEAFLGFTASGIIIICLK